MKFGGKLVSIFQKLITTKSGMPELPEALPSAEEVFEQMVFDDKWKDAEMQSVCHYLRGAKELVIPESFRKILPRTL